jgi:hypothetical protein
MLELIIVYILDPSDEKLILKPRYGATFIA